MHLLSTRPGGFVEDESIVTRLDQTPADIVILSSADTTLALLSSAVAALAGASADFPSVRNRKVRRPHSPGPCAALLRQGLAR